MVDHAERTNVIVAVSYSGDSSSRYPRAGAASRQNQLYWENIAVNAATLRHVTGRTVTFEVHSPSTPTSSVVPILEEARVAVHPTPFRHRPPDGFFERFLGSLYLLDTAAALAEEVDDDDVVLFVDPDVVWLRDLEPLVAEVRRRRLVTYDLRVPPGIPIVGLTREEEHELFVEMTGTRLPELPPHFGGEFYGVVGSALRELMALVPPLWEDTLARHADGRSHFNVEEHVLDAALWQLGVTVGHAHEFIERIMTLPQPFGSRQRYRPELIAWHLPVEKTVGFATVFDRLAGGGSLPPTDDGYHRWMRRRMGIDPTPRHLVRDASRWLKWNATGEARRARERGQVGLGL